MTRHGMRHFALFSVGCEAWRIVWRIGWKANNRIKVAELFSRVAEIFSKKVHIFLNFVCFGGLKGGVWALFGAGLAAWQRGAWRISEAPWRVAAAVRAGLVGSGGAWWRL